MEVGAAGGATLVGISVTQVSTGGPPATIFEAKAQAITETNKTKVILKTPLVVLA